MKALVFHGPGQSSWDDVPDPAIKDLADAIIRVDAVTICGTDLHILKGDVPEVAPGTVLGHEAVGEVVEVGRDVRTVRPGDRVLASCISACGRCRFCREARYGQCLGGGGWVLGHLINGTQAEYARLPFADLSVHPLPGALASKDAVLLADIFPTAYEVGVLNGCVRPGDTVVVVGAGPIGLAAIATAGLFSPGRIIAIDLAPSRLEHARPARCRRRGERRRGPREPGGRTDRGHRSRCDHRGGGRTGELRDVHPDGAPRRARRQYRGPRQTCGAPSRRPLDQGPHADHRAGGHLLHPHTAGDDGRGPASPTASLVTHGFALDRMEEAYGVFSAPSDSGALKVVLERSAA